MDFCDLIKDEYDENVFNSEFDGEIERMLGENLLVAIPEKTAPTSYSTSLPDGYVIWPQDNFLVLYKNTTPKKQDIPAIMKSDHVAFVPIFKWTNNVYFSDAALGAKRLKIKFGEMEISELSRQLKKIQ